MKEKRKRARKADSPEDIDAGNGFVGAKNSNNENNKGDAGNNALSLCREARALWLKHATEREDMEMVEDLYRRALNAKKVVLSKTSTNSKKQKRKRKQVETSASLTRKTVAALSPEEYRKAGERLSLLYLQSSRSFKATMGLKYLGFECRLSEKILNYPTGAAAAAATLASHSRNGKHSKNKKTKMKHHNKESKNDPLLQPPCCVVDDFLSPIELHHLRKIFGDVDSTYWSSHDYIIDKEPPAPYFSYVIDLKQQQQQQQQHEEHGSSNGHGKKTQRSFVRRIIDKILRSGEVAATFPNLRRDAKHVEMWAHNRPHASGHQLHFDSDDEGRSRQEGGFPNHPLCSVVLNVSSHPRVGGPTLVTNQRLRNPETTNLRSVVGWLVPSRPSRLVCFDGSVLHGVVPGKGPIPRTAIEDGGATPRPRRVTLMMAFWKDIRVRHSPKPGSARPWPLPSSSRPHLPAWARELNRTDVHHRGLEESGSAPSAVPREQTRRQQRERDEHVQIIPVPRVYELLDGTPVPKYNDDDGMDGGGYYMPEYDKVFQGF